MAKNAAYKNVYRITVTGRTTNGFTAKIIDVFIRNVVMSIGINWKQSSAEIEVEETVGDYDAANQKYKGER